MEKFKAKQRTIVGVDFGFQCTKVAMSFEGDSIKDLTMFTRSARRVYDPIPTVVEHDDVLGDKQTYAWFKLLALSSDSSESPSSLLAGDMDPEFARKLLRKFLGELLDQIRAFYARQRDTSKKSLPPWHQAKIDFVFSIPSVVSQDGAKTLQTAAEEVGFKLLSHSAEHKVRPILMSEAEAAALGAIREMDQTFKGGDRLLVLDVGGGTSAVAMVIVTDEGLWKHDKGVLHPVTSREVGGAYVDREIRDKMVDVMKSVGIPSASAKFTVEKICHSSRFLSAKEFRTDLEIDISAFGSQGRATTDGMEIKNGKLKVYASCIDAAFAKQLFGPGGENSRVGGIVEQVVTMRDDLLQIVPEGRRDLHGVSVTPSNKIDAVIFAGGVCKSTYLQETVQTYLQMVPKQLADTGLGNIIRDTRFLVCDWPEVCVARGLVHARIEELKNRKNTLETWLQKLKF